MTTPAKCDRVGCTNAAAWHPVLNVRPSGSMISAPMVVSLGLCDEHKAITEVADVLNDAGWIQIIQTFAALKKMKPDRHCTTVSFQPFGKFERFGGAFKS